MLEFEKKNGTGNVGSHPVVEQLTLRVAREQRANGVSKEFRGVL